MKKEGNTFPISMHLSGSLSRPAGRALTLAPTRCERPLKTHTDVEMCGGGELKMQSGFTLIETLVAISLLTVAIVAPMSLTAKSLAAAYYARDQITAFHLAQEAVESVRHLRDHNVLENALGTNTDLLSGIPNDQLFTIDSGNNDTVALCPAEGCPPLQTDPQGELYGYSVDWVNTRFTRSVRAVFVDDVHDEVRVSVTVSWQTGAFQSRSFTISENLYRWVNDASSG